MKSFSEFIHAKRRDPKRVIISEETIDDNRWNQLVRLLEDKRIISITDSFMNDNINARKENDKIVYTGNSVWSLDKDRVVDIDTSVEGVIRIKDRGGWWNTIHYVP